MGKQLAFLTCIILLLSVPAGVTRAALIAYYPFEEGTTTTTVDATGNGHNGTLVGAIEWVPAHLGTGVRFDTAGEKIRIGTINPSGANNAMTLAAWIKWEGSGHATITHQGIFGKRGTWAEPGDNVKWFWEAQPNDNLAFRRYGASVTVTGALTNHKNEWTHVAVTWENGTVIHYINGVQIHRGSLTLNETSNDVIVTIGCVATGNSETFVGTIDEARIYSTALVGDELVRAMKGTPPDLAYAPDPKDGAMVGDTWLSLGWKRGAAAVTHRVYLGTDRDAVLRGDAGTLIGSPAETSLVVGVQNNPFPGGLEPGTTYYWRVDGVNPADPASPWQGELWSFWLPPRMAYQPSPADGTPYALPGTKLAWGAGLKTFMRTVYFGTDPNTVANAAGGLPQLETTFNPGALQPGKTYYWRVDEFDGTWLKGPVWSFTVVPEVPVRDPSLMLRWTLDEGKGLTAVDWSGHGRHGTVYGDTEWVVGYQGTALTFADNVYVEATGYPGVTGVNPRTLCAWVQSSTPNRTIMSWGQNVAGQKWRMLSDATGGLRIEINGGHLFGATNIADGQWHHVAVTFKDDGTPDVVDALLYVDGALETAAGSQAAAVNTSATGVVRIGEDPWHNAPWVGLIDDARIYDKVLTRDDLQQVMRGDPLLAWSFEPANGRTFDIRNVAALSWKAGDQATQHDVYLGFEADAVLNADASDTTGLYRGRQAGTTYVPADGFAWGKTHYWRIDEINADGTISKGGVRSFTIADFLPVEDFESYTDDEGNRIYEFWIDGWTNGTGATVGHLTAPFAERTIVRGGRQSMPLDYNNTKSPFYSEAEYTFATQQNWTTHGVDTLSLWARGNPANYIDRGNGAFTVGASGHDIWDNADDFRFVYKRLNGNGSILVKVESLVNTHAWAKAGVMIRESLDAASPMAYMIQSFSSGVSFGWRLSQGATCGSATQAGITAPRWVKLTRTGNAFTAQHSADGATWTDIRNTDGTVTSTTINMAGTVYIGLCVTSHNAAAATMAEFSGAATSGGVTGAWQQVWIGDDPDRTNSPESLYVAVQDSAGKMAVVSHPALVYAAAWTRWTIPLSDLAGVNLARVKTLYIGVGDPAKPAPGGSGVLYLDDITLTRATPDTP